MLVAAAPTCFPAHPMTVEGNKCALIDGGVVTNNPTACAIAEALRKDACVERELPSVVGGASAPCFWLLLAYCKKARG